MGMIASYMMVDEPTLNKFMELDVEDVADHIFDMEEEGSAELTDIDKSWDGLHFILTGKSASEPIEGDALSEAIAGVEMFDEKGEEFIAYIPHSRLKEIVKALESVDVEKLKKEFNPAALNENEIYPTIWEDEDKDGLFDYLIDGYNAILALYKDAVGKNMNIVVSIL